jgi:DNA-binding response OmpR family regulator
MSFSPVFDTPDSTLVLTDERLELVRSARVSRATREMLRYGGLIMDPVTGATHFRGKAVVLALEEREMLGTLMRRAGQIVSRERLAAAVGIPMDALDRRVEALRSDLKAAGVTCLPCRVDGLGYVLWRC